MNKPQLAQIVLEEINRQEDIRKTATIIQEELLVFKLNQDILKEHQKLIKERKDFWSVVLQEYLKAEHGDKFDSSLIEEGIWTNIKYNIGKLGSLEKGGKIFGKRKERVAAALEKVQAAIDGAMKKGFGDFKKNIEAEHKEFPNMREKVDFMAALYEIGGVYDSAEAAVESGNFPGGPAAANYLVKALREYVKWLLDFQLADAYKHFTEEKEIPEDVLAEQLQEWHTKNLKEAPIMPGNVGAATDTRQPQLQKGRTAAYAAPEGPTGASYTKAGREGDEVDSATIKGLKSNKAPAVLAALGALGAGFGWLVQQPWFIAMFKDPGQWVTLKNVIMGTDRVGVTEQLAVLQGTPGANLSQLGVGDFVKQMASKGLVDGAGNPTKNLLDMASAGGNTGFANWWTTNIANAVTTNPAATLEQVIPLSGAGAPGAGGDVFTPKIAKIVTKTVFRQGATSLGAYQLAAAGPWIAALGIGLVSAGAAVKLLRMKGMKSSRAQMLADLYKELVDFPVPEESKIQQAIDPEPEKKDDDIEQTSDDTDLDRGPVEPVDPITEPGLQQEVIIDYDTVQARVGDKVDDPVKVDYILQAFEAANKNDKIKFKLAPASIAKVQKENINVFQAWKEYIASEEPSITTADVKEVIKAILGIYGDAGLTQAHFEGMDELPITKTDDEVDDEDRTKKDDETKITVDDEEVITRDLEPDATPQDDLSLTKDVSRWDKGEEPVDTTVSVDPEKGEEEEEEEVPKKKTYRLPPKFKQQEIETRTGKTYKVARLLRDLEGAHAQQFPENSFEEDWGEFVDALGDIKRQMSAPVQEGGTTVAKMAGAFGKEKASTALAHLNNLQKKKDTGSYRILQSLKKPHDARVMVPLLTRVLKSVTKGGVSSKQTADATSAPPAKLANVAEAMGEGILKESVLGRWKTLSGISKGDG